MRSRAHLDGHPIHPMLIPFPFAYMLGSVCIDTAASMANQPRWYPTARHMRNLGIATALVAAVPGIVDYLFAVPPQSSARQRATLHGLANVTALGLFAAIGRRRQGDLRPQPWEVAVQVAGAGLMSVAGWLGGTLVYRNQVGVDHRYADAGKWKERALPAPETAGSAIDVGSPDDLGVDQMALLHVGGRRIVLARIDEGFAAFDDRCSHRGGPLSDGALSCGTVQCPWHGSQFDVRTGGVKHGPAETPIAVHHVTERDGRLWLRLAE
jgi:nitrite reductase/ring-hydroxylating ferredoxin subunit/uncharacterized membrane protein